MDKFLEELNGLQPAHLTALSKCFINMQSKERDSLVRALLRIFDDKLDGYVRLLFDLDLLTADDCTTALRQNSLFTRSIVILTTEVSARSFLLDCVLSPLLAFISSQDSPCLTFTMNPEESNANLQPIIELTKSFIDSITNTKPVGCVTAICKMIANSSPSSEDQRINISNFIFLRIICPALVSSSEFGLLPKIPPLPKIQSLVLVAKILQQIAIGSQWQNGKDDHLMCLTPFLNENIPLMGKWLDSLCDSTLDSILPSNVTPSDADIQCVFQALHPAAAPPTTSYIPPEGDSGWCLNTIRSWFPFI